MNQQRHNDAVLAHLLEQVAIRTAGIVTEEQNQFNAWANENMAALQRAQDALRDTQIELQREREHSDKQARHITMLEDAIKLVDIENPDTKEIRGGKDWLLTFSAVFQVAEQERDKEFAEVITPLPIGTPDGLPVEPTPEDANHRD